MKRVVSVLMLMVLVLSLTACGYIPKKITAEDSEANRRKYVEALTDTVSEFGCDMVVNTDEGSYEPYIEIEVNEYETISIDIVYDEQSGVESFSAEYVIYGTFTDPTINTRLFIEVVSDISANELSEDSLMDFLNSPESEHSAEDYGFNKTEDMITYKYCPLNFWEDWTLCFTHYRGDELHLVYSGFTKSR